MDNFTITATVGSDSSESSPSSESKHWKTCLRIMEIQNRCRVWTWQKLLGLHWGNRRLVKLLEVLVCWRKSSSSAKFNFFAPRLLFPKIFKSLDDWYLVTAFRFNCKGIWLPLLKFQITKRCVFGSSLFGRG